jgi:uncharacterized protein (TIGR02118 family)
MGAIGDPTKAERRVGAEGVPGCLGGVRTRGQEETVPYKLYAYWSAPKAEDVEEFERYYADTHVPRAAAVPNLVALNTTRTKDGFEGGATDHYRVAEMVFDSAAAMAESEASEEWATMRACSGDIIERFGVTLTVESGELVEGPGTA